MKLVFMGTPDFSVPILRRLIAEHEVVAVYTRAPKQSGRGKKVNKSPVHLLAEEHGIGVFTPKSLRFIEEQDILQTFKADMAVVAAYGLLLPQAVLDMFPLGCVNVHASLLPRWRGAAPIQRAIEFGDSISGISIMKMALELDAGDILSQKSIDITSEMTGGDLHDALSLCGAELLSDTLKKFDEYSPLKQDESLVTYAEKLNKAECLIDFKMNTEKLLLKIRAFCPYPAMYFTYKGERFKVLKAQKSDMRGKESSILEGKQKLVIATNDGSIEILEIQREGKHAMAVRDFLRGFSFDEGCILSD